MGRATKSNLVILAVVGAVVTASTSRSLAAQPSPGGFVGVSLIAADAVGELATTVDQGYGLELSGAAPMDAGGRLRLRADLGFVVYGLERIHYCGFTCRVASELTTANTIVYGGIGPEIVLADGPVQPYVNVSAGLSYFVTSSSLDDNDGLGPYLQTTNFSDVVFGWRVGGGLRVRLGRKPVYFDLGVDRHDNGVATFLTEGDIVDHPDGSVTLFPNRSDADLVSLRMGVSIGIH